jgi:hypothetical protein
LSSSDQFCPSVSGHGSSSRFYLSTLSRLSQGIAHPHRVTLMVRPLLLAEPGLGDASCTVWTLTVFFHLLYLQAGRPSSKSAFCWSSTLRSSPSVSNLSTFCVRLRSYDFHRSFPICRSSALVSDLSIFFDRFQSYDFLRPFPVFRPSPSSCDSNLAPRSAASHRSMFPPTSRLCDRSCLGGQELPAARLEATVTSCCECGCNCRL